MTDYNDGKWHGWNGGECPVHPESVIDYVWHDTNQWGAEGGKSGVTTGRPARKGVAWGQVIRFRVVKAYREPRTFWAVGKHLHDTLADAEAFCDALERDHPGKGYGDKSRIVKLVEVLE